MVVSVVRGHGERLVRVVVILVVAVAVARFWHPFFGFTRFLQLDAPVVAEMTPVLRGAPIFAYADDGGYDGHYYGQIASDPTLREPGLGGGMDNFAYRARRILTPFLAYGLAAGDPVGAVRTYAWLNLVAWSALAAVLWVLLPLGEWRRTVAWAGLLLSVGALHSVRFALADLPALAWFAGGWLAWERRCVGAAAACFAASALTRETMLLAVAVVVIGERRKAGWCAAAVLSVVAVAPLVGWLVYLQIRFGSPAEGVENFQLPWVGLVRRWGEAFGYLQTERNPWLAWSTLLSLASLTGQLAFLGRPGWRDPLWWLGVAFGLMAMCLNHGVWEGHPGAAPRVLLPLSFAFWLLVARAPVSRWWLFVGLLAVPAGWLCLSPPNRDPRELAAGREQGALFRVEIGDGFYGVEARGSHRWTWCRGAGELCITVWPRQVVTCAVTVGLSAPVERRVSVAQGDRVLWTGRVGPRRSEITCADVCLAAGQATLRVVSAEPPSREPDAAGGRQLSFAVHGLRLERASP